MTNDQYVAFVQVLKDIIARADLNIALLGDAKTNSGVDAKQYEKDKREAENTMLQARDLEKELDGQEFINAFSLLVATKNSLDHDLKVYGNLEEKRQVLRDVVDNGPVVLNITNKGQTETAAILQDVKQSTEWLKFDNYELLTKVSDAKGEFEFSRLQERDHALFAERYPPPSNKLDAQNTALDDDGGPTHRRVRSALPAANSSGAAIASMFAAAANTDAKTMASGARPSSQSTATASAAAPAAVADAKTKGHNRWRSHALDGSVLPPAQQAAAGAGAAADTSSPSLTFTENTRTPTPLADVTESESDSDAPPPPSDDDEEEVILTGIRPRS